jgi:hypothetical protein
MPRNGSGVLSAPAGTLGTPNTVIESAKYNAFVNDWVSDGNAARPITAGGTGGITAVAGADNLSTKGTDIPSAATTDIGAATGRYVHITGTTTITGLGTKTAGVLRIVTFDGALTLTHNAISLILPGATSIVTAAGDVASFVSEGGGNWRCASYSRASGGALVSGVYLPKAGNYTTVDADYDASIRFSAAATLSIDVSANLRTNWRQRIWADGGQVIIDPNSTDTINGAATLVLQQGQKALIYKTGATTFQADVYSDALSGPQVQGFFSGLAVTTNATDTANDIDIAVGVAAHDVSPYNLMQLTSALTKRLDAAWVVGTNQGGLDTGAVGNNTYYIWLIQRSDTGITDVLFSLSSTAPTMPTNYDRKRLLGTLIRVAATNGEPAPTGNPNIVKAQPAITPSGTATTYTGIEAGVNTVVIKLLAMTLSANAQLWMRLGTGGGIVSAGYDYAATGLAAASTQTVFATSATFAALFNSSGPGPVTGSITLKRLRPNAHDWTIEFAGKGSAARFQATASITLSAELTQFQISSVAGTSTLGGTNSLAVEWWP